ncbi:Rieske (2Fe-2S) protein [Halieaceae bacterium IMCC14734]|uniref:Rieske (2Fe-2S) protein n=1 Tax=Candidatus Litorirhabdus singularis TaxID=2518993 RepID=A0ABT3TBQ7_9GAMM|nr:Rieske (2Fe-2S) protein [Candidatus Litorirhabdus singularis]MCX2979698.1 Rieske (2Fe-2S) protein [Candidatus Litorirhabdus singularis]
MSALQADPLNRNPNGLELVSVATYTRLVGASIERVWENVLDWEHLPHLHDTSFSFSELDEAGAWGWRCWSDAEHVGHIELCVMSDRYVARTYSHGKQFSEIWTGLRSQGDATAVEVEFLVADVAADQVDGMGQIYRDVYQQLWDEDEAMMRERQRRLDERRSADAQVVLGTEAAVAQRLPFRFQWRRQEFELIERDSQLLAVPTICPHLLGPLATDLTNPDVLSCPWHGYQFDRRSGDCLSPVGARCRLPAAPVLSIRDGMVVAGA